MKAFIGFVVIRLRNGTTITSDVCAESVLGEYRRIDTLWRAGQRGPWTLNYTGPDRRPKSATFRFEDIASIEGTDRVR